VTHATTFRGCGARDQVRAVELTFAAGPIVIAAATPFGDDPRELAFCYDDVMVGFGRDSALRGALLSDSGGDDPIA
jgi:hypothetical protein